MSPIWYLYLYGLETASKSVKWVLFENPENTENSIYTNFKTPLNQDILAFGAARKI